MYEFPISCINVCGLSQLKKQQQAISSCDMTNYKLAYSSDVEPKQARKSTTPLKLPPISPSDKSSSENTTTSTSRRSSLARSPKNKSKLDSSKDTSSCTSPLTCTLTSQTFGSRVSHPLEVYGSYCRGKCTAEKTLGWPRFWLTTVYLLSFHSLDTGCSSIICWLLLFFLKKKILLFSQDGWK